MIYFSLTFQKQLVEIVNMIFFSLTFQKQLVEIGILQREVGGIDKFLIPTNFWFWFFEKI